MNISRLKKHLPAIIGYALVTVTFWLSGLDFTERSRELGLWFIMAPIGAAFAQAIWRNR